MMASVLLLAVNSPIVGAVAVPDTSQTTTVPSSSSTTTDPVTQKPTYTYDTQTGHWNTDKWAYDASTGTYQAVVPPKPVVIQPPTQPTIDPVVAPTIISPKTTNTSSPVGSQNASITNNSTNQSVLSNTIGANAQTGNASVVLNTTGGNATTGDATSAATIINNVDSTLSAANNQKAASFVTDVMGNVNGDIILQPMILKTVLESGASPTSSTVNVSNTNTLTNNVDLSASTGNAGVVGNTTAGNATSGSANTVANVVNIINSMVAAKQSFIGTVNIYGNLNGDILIAPDFIPQLLGSNGTGNTSTTTPNTTVINATDMQSVINNVSLAAQSGKAAVMDNTSAGNATTGNANTNVVIFNLTGHDIIASNSLLVFVNVLGKWVGVIVDAPLGSTAAAIGNGVKTNAVASPDLTIVSNNTNQITNNIKLASQSGNATVASNTKAGNATSGNATASANIANITNSQFGLSGWFGVLFINVFGSWFGSFGINTSAGNPIVSQNNTTSTAPRVIEFIPSTSRQSSADITLISKNSNEAFGVTTVQSHDVASVLGSTAPTKKIVIKPTTTSSPTNEVNLSLLAGSILIIIISAVGINRFVLAIRN